MIPPLIVQEALDRGITLIAITDHNSTRAYPGALDAARAVGIRLIPGVELDCHLRGVNLHVLGYGIDPAAAEFESYAWKERSGTMRDEPEKVNDHAMDALRYGVMYLDRDTWYIY